MIVGTPGTGIGGLFYLLLAAWMPIRQVYCVVRGRALPGGWRIVASSITQGSAMIGALFGEAWVIKNHIAPWLLQIGNAAHVGPTKANLAINVTAVAPCVALLPFLALAFVLLCVHVARLLGLSDRGRRERAMQAAEVPPPAAAVQPIVVTVKDR